MKHARQLRQRMAQEKFLPELLAAFLFVWVTALGEARWLASDWSLGDITLLAAAAAGAVELGEMLWVASAPNVTSGN